MIEFFLTSMDLVRVLLGIFSGFFIGVWFSMSMQTYYARIPYVIVDPEPQPKSYNWLTPKNFKDPLHGNPRDEHSGGAKRKSS